MTDNLSRIATYWSSFDAETAKLHLDSHGIPAIVTSGAMNAMLGELGGTLSPIELLVREEDLERASLALDEFLSKENADDWTCTRCNESVPGSFSICWSCNGDRATFAAPKLDETNRPNLSESLDVTADTFVEKNQPVLAADQASLSLPYAPPNTTSSRSRLGTKEPIASSTYSSSELEAMVDRAWRASIIGMLLPPILHLYSLYLLLQSCRSTEPLSPPHQRRFIMSLVINFLVISTFAFVGVLSVLG